MVPFRKKQVDKIPYSKHKLDQEDIDAVINTLKSDFLTQGDTVKEFEDAICNITLSKYGVATNSGTSALHIACLSLGIELGDYLWTSAISFVASANCGLYCGAKVDFVDIEYATANICTIKLEQKLIKAKENDNLPKVLVVVHMAGLPCDLPEIFRLSKIFGFHIIEDAAHAFGSKLNNSYIGNCLYSDITIFSFHPAKTITTGEGGIALTNNSIIAKKMMMLRSHGITKNPDDWETPHEEPWHYEQQYLGFNFRMSDIHASLGLSQLKKLDIFVTERNSLAKHYNELLSSLPLLLPTSSVDSYSSYHLYVVRLKGEKNIMRHTKIIKGLIDKNINVNVHYIPIFMQPFFINQDINLNEFSESINYHNSAISLPLYPGLLEQQQQYIVACLKELLL